MTTSLVMSSYILMTSPYFAKKKKKIQQKYFYNFNFKGTLKYKKTVQLNIEN